MRCYLGILLSLCMCTFRDDYSLQPQQTTINSFGEVYRVRSRVDGVEYAVKCTRHRFKGHAHRDRYLQEVKALAKVCNSDSEEVLHIVRYHQAWIEDERLYMQVSKHLKASRSLPSFWIVDNNHPFACVW